MAMLGGIELAPLLTKIKVDIKGFQTDMDKVKTEAIGKANEVSKEMEKTIKVGENMSKLGGTMTKTLTLPILGAGTAVAKLAVDYETSFAKVSTLLDSNIVDYAEYKNAMLDASNQSKIAIGEFSDAVYESISAGVDQTKAIDFTTEAMKLAKGGFTEGAKAVDVLTTAMNVYGLGVENTSHLADVLITTQNLGKTTVDELANSIGQVIPIASQLDMSFEDTMAVMATLTKNGIGTSEAVTGLKASLSNIIKPTKEASEAADALGLDFSAASLQSKGLVPFLDDIKASLKNAAPEFAMLSDKVSTNYEKMAELEKQGLKNSGQYKLLKANAKSFTKEMESLAQANESTIGGFATLFGSVEGLNSMMVLTSETGGKDLIDFTDAMYNSAGAAQTAFEKMDATPMEKLKGSLNELKNSGIKLGQAMIPMVTKLADVISGVANWITELTPEQQEMILKTVGMVAAMGPLLKVTGGAVSTFGKLKPLVSGVSTLFSKGAPLVSKFASSLGGGTKAAASLAGGIPKITNVVGSMGLKMMDCSIGPVAKLGTAMAGAATSGGGLLAGLGGIVTAVAPFALGAAAIGAAAYGIYKVFDKDLIPEVDLFASETTSTFNQLTGQWEITTVKVSEESQKQIQSYMDLSNSAQQESTNMFVGITKITDENVASITSKVNGMSDSIITATNTQRDGVTKGFTEMFTNTTVLTNEEQVEIMTSVNAGYDARITKTTELKDELTAIYQNIADNGGSIAQTQQERINQIYEEMKVQSVQAMSENEAEQNMILNRLKGSNERNTAEMVANTIKQMNEARDKQVAIASEKRDALVLEAEKLKTLEGGKYAEKADQIIEAANKEYEGIVRNAEKAKDKGIDKLMLAHEDLADEVDINTGEIIGFWDFTAEKWSKTKFDDKYPTIHFKTLGMDVLNAAKEAVASFNYNGLDYVPFDGYNARLHEGERVLTKKENEAYSDGFVSGIPASGKIVLDVSIPVDGRELAHVTKEFTAEELGFGLR